MCRSQVPRQRLEAQPVHNHLAATQWGPPLTLPIAGWRLTGKDSWSVRGQRTTATSTAHKRNEYRAQPQREQRTKTNAPRAVERRGAFCEQSLATAYFPT